MALVQCRECSSEISDSAATCPRCGVSFPAGVGTLTFVRPSLSGGAIGVEVFVDGQPYGKLKARGKVSVPVAPGNHHVELTSTRGKSGVGSISTGSGDTTVNVGFNLMGSPKFG
ncbi:hypothetical protein [Kocuria rhizosphaericola]|uniref:hypothetical protein n=1 Tax=Kocuria rhizosphaericola TaxID=3376284 RepID=UPI0037A02E07